MTSQFQPGNQDKCSLRPHTSFGGILTIKASFIFSGLVFTLIQCILYQDTVACTLRLINIWLFMGYFLSSRRKILFTLLLEDMDDLKDGQGVTHLSVSAQDMESSEKLSDSK